MTNLKANIEIPAAVAGRYKLIVRNADLSIKEETPWFDNLVTDAGLEQIGTSPGLANAIAARLLAYCHVGTGTTTPANGDTALATFLVSTNNTIGSTTSTQASSPYYGKKVVTYRFNPGQATGNISEVGVCYQNSGSGPLFSRALVLDGGGSPTTITVLANEWLDVTYELRCYPPTSDVTGSVVIGGTTYNYTIRACAVTTTIYWAGRIGEPQGRHFDQSDAFDFSGAIGAITTTPSGTNNFVTTYSQSAYSANSKSLTFNLYWDITVNRTFQSMYWKTNYGAYQAGFSPSITMDGSHTLTLSFFTSWTRHTFP